MYGDTKFTWHTSGSNGASANTGHNLVGAALNTLSVSDVIHLQVLGSANNVNIFPSQARITEGPGMRLVAGNDYYVDMPPMKVSDAKNLVFINETAGQNGQVRWLAWIRT